MALPPIQRVYSTSYTRLHARQKKASHRPFSIDAAGHLVREMIEIDGMVLLL